MYRAILAELACYDRGFSEHLIKLLAVQLVILLFADDVALFARLAIGLHKVFVAFEGFCTREHLNISREKTKVVI